ncbi:MAG: hypothetical protein JOY78_20380 [Pseudonocardia sp.]|nr:hypothetical protein [Pseudonocardia sp.]
MSIGDHDDLTLAELGVFTPEGRLTPGYGDHYLFMVGRDDVHGILGCLIPRETLGFKLGMFGFDDQALNDAIMALMGHPGIHVQISLDRSQAAGVHERAILAADAKLDPVDFANSVVILESATHQISHTKGGVLASQGIGFEGSTNWSASGEGTGISLQDGVANQKGFKAQNNTLLVSTNPVFLARFSARLDVEHQIGLAQQRARESK